MVRGQQDMGWISYEFIVRNLMNAIIDTSLFIPHVVGVLSKFMANQR